MHDVSGRGDKRRGPRHASSAKATRVITKRPGGRIDPFGDTAASSTELGASAELGPPDAHGGTLTAAESSVRAESADELVGCELAHFYIEKRLGRGGMGDVYLATDTGLDRYVAIKVLPTEIAEDERRRMRFYREARAQARLHHPNVCHIYFIGEERGRLFFAMEYIDGESLQTRLKREGKIPPGEAVELCRMAASGLCEAYRHGFIHRDIKPSNLMIDRNGTLKIVDFGLVTRSGDGEESDPLSLTGKPTAILGTPLYMAPEQAKGEEVDFRADIYALGTTLHHMVAGKPPFNGSSAMSIIAKHLSEARPRVGDLERRRHAWSQLDDICDQMMAKKPEDRFADYEDLLAALARLSPAHSRPAGLWVRSFALSIDCVVIGILAAAITAVLPGSPDWIMPAVAPLYIIGCHNRWRCTLGKAALDLELVPIDRAGAPSLSRSVLRFVAQWAPAYVAGGLGAIVASVFASGDITRMVLLGILLTVGLLYMPVAAIWAVWTDPRKRTLWDRASDTQMCYRNSNR